MLPFSNQILGPIPGTTELISNDTVMANFTNASVPGSGYFSLINTTTNSTPSTCAGYLDAVDSVNPDSVSRIPVYVWLGLLVIVGGNILARYASIWHGNGVGGKWHGNGVGRKWHGNGVGGKWHGNGVGVKLNNSGRVGGKWQEGGRKMVGMISVKKNICTCSICVWSIVSCWSVLLFVGKLRSLV